MATSPSDRISSPKRLRHCVRNLRFSKHKSGLILDSRGDHLLLMRDCHRTPLFRLGAGDTHVRLGLVHLQAGAYVSTNSDVRNVNGHQLECRLGIESGFQDLTRDDQRICQCVCVSVAGPDRRNNPLPNTCDDCSFCSSTNELSQVCAHSHKNADFELNAVSGNGIQCRTTGVQVGTRDDYGIHAHTNGFEDVTTGKVNCSGRVPRQVDARPLSDDQRLGESQDIPASEKMRFEFAARCAIQPRLCSENLRVHDDRRLHAAKRHEDERRQTNTGPCDPASKPQPEVPDHDNGEPGEQGRRDDQADVVEHAGVLMSLLRTLRTAFGFNRLL